MIHSADHDRHLFSGIPARPGFTLIELMVVMAIIAFLAALVMLVVPSVLDHDRARDAATQLQGALQNARLRAVRDGSPRGVRLLPDSNSFTPTTISGSNFFTLVTASSYQYIEVPPWLILTNQSTKHQSTNPYLQLQYTIGTNGQISSRQCIIGNLTHLQYFQVSSIVGTSQSTATTNQLPPTLGLPTLNFWTTIQPQSFNPYPNPNSPPTAFPYACTITLNNWPDSMMGGASNLMIYAGNFGTSPGYFGIYQSPRPLLGEPIVQMPLNSTVDLSDSMSRPSLSQYPGPGLNNTSGALQVPGYDILFSPGGQLMEPYGSGQVNLWIRDPKKGTVGAFNAVPMSPYAYYNSSFPLFLEPGYQAALSAGGEQMIVSIKAYSGATGVTPILVPTNANQTPWDFATSGANMP